MVAVRRDKRGKCSLQMLSALQWVEVKLLALRIFEVIKRKSGRAPRPSLNTVLRP